MAIQDQSVLLVGVGGLGCPVGLVLARSGVRRLTLIDDDVVEESNLQRQPLYDMEDVGKQKIMPAKTRLELEASRFGFDMRVRVIEDRLHPGNAERLFDKHDIVVEGTDNLPSKFLACDASCVTGTPIVQAGIVRWNGWAMASVPGISACLRCVFEDIPADPAPNCAEAGVVGPVVAVIGALQASLALQLMQDVPSALGMLHHFDGLGEGLRKAEVSRRSGCLGCSGVKPDISMERYLVKG